MAISAITHTAKSVEHAAQALSDAASRGGDASTLVERIIVDAASVILMLSALYGLRLGISSYVNQLPEAVDTLLQIKTFFGPHQNPAIGSKYLEKYKSIRKDVEEVSNEASDDHTFHLGRRYVRFQAYRQANKEAHLLLDSVKLLATELFERNAPQTARDVEIALTEGEHRAYQREVAEVSGNGDCRFRDDRLNSLLLRLPQHANGSIDVYPLYRCNGPGMPVRVELGFSWANLDEEKFLPASILFDANKRSNDWVV